MALEEVPEYGGDVDGETLGSKKEEPALKPALTFGSSPIGCSFFYLFPHATAQKREAGEARTEHRVGARLRNFASAATAVIVGIRNRQRPSSISVELGDAKLPAPLRAGSGLQQWRQY